MWGPRFISTTAGRAHSAIWMDANLRAEGVRGDARTAAKAVERLVVDGTHGD